VNAPTPFSLWFSCCGAAMERILGEGFGEERLGVFVWPLVLRGSITSKFDWLCSTTVAAAPYLYQWVISRD